MGRKMNPGEIIDAERDPPPLAAKYLRDLLLGLDHLNEHLLVHSHAGRCKAAHIRPDILHLRRDDDLTRLFCVHGIKERILSPLPSQLPPDLPRNPFAAPEVRPVAVAQLDLKLITLEIIPLELPLDPLEVLFDFLRRERGTHQEFKVFLFYANRRQLFCSSLRCCMPNKLGNYSQCVRFVRIMSRLPEKRSRISWISSATIAILSSPSPQAITGT